MAERKQEYYNSVGPAEQNAKAKWWLSPEDARYRDIWALYHRMVQYQDFRTSNNIKFARLYSNMELLGLKAGLFSSVSDPKNFIKNRVTYNIIKSCIDTVTAKMSMIKPRPVYLSDNAPFGTQQKAKRLEQYVLGCFQNIGTGTGPDRDMWGIGTQSFRDGALFGLGPTYFFIDKNSKKVKAERSISDEILVDETEGMYRMPRQLHRHRYMFREVLVDKYPKKEHIIMAAKNPLLGTGSSSNSAADVVSVLESWHLQSGEKSGDGLFVTSLETGDIAAEEWDEDFFPFVFQRWSLRPLGFYGQGLAEELIGLQLEINKMLRNIQLSQNLMSVPQTWLDFASKNIAKNMNNERGGIRYYTGRPPVQTVPMAMSAEYYAHVEKVYQRGFEISGISALSATSQKPQGLDSAPSLREYKDTETERFAVQAGEYDNYYVESAEMVRKMSRRMQRGGIEPISNFVDGNSLVPIRFKDVDLPDNKIMVTASAARLLPKEPAGKLAFVKDVMELGLYTSEESLELMDFPDTQKVNNLKLAARRDIIKVIETMLEKNVYIPPEPYMNIDLAAIMAQSYYLNGKCDDMPLDRLEMLQTFMDDLKVLIDKRDAAAAAKQQAAAAAKQQAAAQPVPAAAPMPMPDSAVQAPIDMQQQLQQPANEQQAV